MQRLRKRIHVSPATAIATLALVFAMTGGAYAAKHYLITSTKQISPKVLSALKGKTGPTGPAGPAGAAGVGTAGATGPQGPGGAAGVKGENGAPGAAGGEGKEGKEGSFNTTLPKGKTLKGVWGVTGVLPAPGLLEGSAFTAVSFGIPLGGAPEVVYVKVGEATPAGCVGSVGEPGAEPGHLCVFASFEHNGGNVGVCPSSGPAISCVAEELRKADPVGFVVGAIAEEKGLMILNGTWAVTAE